MNNKEITELVDTHINDEPDKDSETVERDKKLLTNAVQYVTDRMNLSKEICKKVFGEKEVGVDEVYSMFDYLSREMAVQITMDFKKRLGPGVGAGAGSPDDLLSKFMSDLKRTGGGSPGGSHGGGFN